MAIPAKRFELLDRETKVGSANFASLFDSGIRNISDNAVKLIPESLSGLISSATQSITSVTSDFSNIFKEVERKTVSGIGSYIDFSSLDKKELSDFTSVIAGGKSDISKTLQDVFTKCTRSNSGLGYGGRPYRPSLNCYNGKMSVGYGGGYTNCNAGSYNDLLGKLAGNDALKQIFDKLKALTALLSLSNHGYSLGMCGIFGSLMNSGTFGNLGLDKIDYSKAAGVLLSTLGTSKNTMGWVDVASSSIVNELNPTHFSPSAVADLLTNFKTPDQAAERDLGQIALSVVESIEGVDPSWNKNDESSLSIGNYGRVTADAKDTLGVLLQNRSFGKDMLDFIPSDDSDFTLGSLIAI